VRPLTRALQSEIFMPCDVAAPGQLEAVYRRIAQDWGRLDFVQHSIAYARKEDLSRRITDCSAEGFAIAMNVSVQSCLRMAKLSEPLMTAGGRSPAMSYRGAILAKMADRGQIVGVVVDGPLDLDAAVDAEAARVKNISSPVAGCADVLIVPNIEAGNMVYKNLAFMADAQTADLVVGARTPVILTSRADSPAARRFSAAAAVLYADALARESAIVLPETAE
jgi:phosphate acetyltransferase